MKYNTLLKKGIVVDAHTCIYNDTQEGKQKVLTFLKEYTKHTKTNFCVYRGCLSVCDSAFNNKMFFIPECEPFAWLDLCEVVENCDIIIAGALVSHTDAIDTGCETVLRFFVHYIESDGTLVVQTQFRVRDNYCSAWFDLHKVRPDRVFDMRVHKALLYDIEEKLQQQISDCRPKNSSVPCEFIYDSMYKTKLDKLTIVVHRIKVNSDRWYVELTVKNHYSFWVEFCLPRVVYDKFGNKLDENGEVIEELDDSNEYVPPTKTSSKEN